MENLVFQMEQTNREQQNSYEYQKELENVLTRLQEENYEYKDQEERMVEEYDEMRDRLKEAEMMLTSNEDKNATVLDSYIKREEQMKDKM